LIGCGTYADGYAAVSCTGLGEDIIRTVLARHVAYLVEQGLDTAAAARQAMIHFTDKTHSEAGLILVNRNGQVRFARNSAYMPVCALAADGSMILEA
ncbi:MAG: isoaspartyl peptidase/L-asparaginase, partial [Gammaproteobacteria bacterium]